jgi:hypothetical protein
MVERHVLVELGGGLGNQLFQYAAGVSMAAELDGHLWLRRQNVSWGLALDEFMSLDHLCPPSSVETSFDDVRPDQLLIRETAWGYRPRTFATIPTSVRLLRLDGNFQHPTWFERGLPRVIDELRCRLEDSVAPEDKGQAVISFRRGDYVQLGWALPASYYESAAASLRESSTNACVIGDDPFFVELAIPWLRGLGVDAQSAPTMPDKVSRDLALLAFARIVVMSNSTFCWWGVMAGDMAAQDRMVIAPRPWLAAVSAVANTTEDPLLRPNWHIVQVGHDLPDRVSRNSVRE